MATFTKQVEFKAYQFNPGELKGLDDYAIEDVIIEALTLRDGIKDAFIRDNGNLYVVIYNYGGEDGNKLYFELTPGQWLVEGIFGGYVVIPDEEFREFATPKN